MQQALDLAPNHERPPSGFIDDRGYWVEDFAHAVRRCYGNQPKVPTLSLFSGAGGLDIGFHDAGFDIIESVEIEDMFAKTLTLNSGHGRYFPSTRVNCVDIRQFDTDRDIEFIIGGPPCQSFSAAGRRASGVAGTTDARGTLFLEYVRLLKKLRPVGFVFENVYGIMGAQQGAAWQQIVNAFSETGYRLHHRILDAADYGVPQHRERLLIVGLREGAYRFPTPTHGPDSLTGLGHYGAAQSLVNVTAEAAMAAPLGGELGHLLPDIPPGLNYSYYTEKMGHPNPVFAWRSKFSDFLYKADGDRPVRTIKAQGGQYTGPFHWDSRRFSIAELKRLQTFPDSYRIYGGRGKIIHQIGNSVPPQLARILAISIKEQVFGQRAPLKLHLLGEQDKLGFRARKRLLTQLYGDRARQAIAAQHGGNKSAKSPLRESTETFEFGKKLIIEPRQAGSHLGTLTCQDDSVRVAIGTGSGDPHEITIRPAKSWSLPAREIVLSWTGTGIEHYVMVWKFLEYQLRIQSAKSDLVQLAGYYQYPPNIRIQWHDSGNNPEYQALRILTSPVIARRTLPEKTIYDSLERYGMEPLAFLRKIKAWGLDVRNSNTNPMMDSGHLLIPYEFPTLYFKSVQLAKEL